MKVSVHGENFRLQEDTEAFAKRKLEGLSRFLPNIREIRMELERQQNKRGEDTLIVQVTLTHERGAILRAEERNGGFDREAIEGAINEAVDKMYRRIARFKGKKEAARLRLRDRGLYLATPEELAAAQDVPGEEADEFEEIEVVRRKRIAVSTMTEREAIAQMELLGHTFFLFRDEGNGHVNVVYRRRDGTYGILLPNSDKE